MSAGSAPAIRAMISEKIRVRIPNGVRSDAGLSPVELSMMLGKRSTARSFIAPPDMFCRFSAILSSVNAPWGRLGTPPGVVTYVPPAPPP
jgi:hypothetical protein